MKATTFEENIILICNIDEALQIGNSLFSYTDEKGKVKLEDICKELTGAILEIYNRRSKKIADEIDGSRKNGGEK